MAKVARPGGRDPRAFLSALFHAAIDAASPASRLAPFLPAPPQGRTIVVGAGKAAASMAAAVEAAWRGPLEGLVVTRYGHGAPTQRIEVVEAAHPVPDAAGEKAALRILECVKGLTADDLVLCLVSGGGSALLAAPAPGLTLDDKRAVNRALLNSGADIAEMNCVRKHLSAIKGGRLALAAAPARVVGLVISDVPGDDLAVIGSGPTVADPSTSAEALAILWRHAIDAPARVVAHLESPASETPKPGDPRFASVSNVIVAAPRFSLRAAAAAARAAGVTPVLLGDAIEGEAREVGKVFAGIARSAARHGEPAPGPCVLLSGGETTVTVRGKGRGGRNTRIPARPGAGARRRAGRLGARRRHRRNRRRRGQRRRDRRPRHAQARRRVRPRSARASRRQRRLFVVRRAWRPRRHRPDAHQRQ